jgi:hypothetical protein
VKYGLFALVSTLRFARAKGGSFDACRGAHERSDDLTATVPASNYETTPNDKKRATTRV